jgi:hypothetical protein
MYCPKCGAQNIEDAQYCRGCGENISLVSQAMTGHLPETRSDSDRGVVGVVFDPTGRRHRHKDDAPRLDKAIKTGFMGLAFLLIAIILAFAGDRRQYYWYWLLIPAFTMLGGGLAEYVRVKQAAGKEKQLPDVQSRAEATVSAPARVSALPPRNTSELVQPPSVTESTTRHLNLSAEAPTRHINQKQKPEGRNP